MDTNLGYTAPSILTTMLRLKVLRNIQRARLHPEKKEKYSQRL